MFYLLKQCVYLILTVLVISVIKINLLSGLENELSLEMGGLDGGIGIESEKLRWSDIRKSVQIY